MVNSKHRYRKSLLIKKTYRPHRTVSLFTKIFQVKSCQNWSEHFCSFETENLSLVVTRWTPRLHNLFTDAWLGPYTFHFPVNLKLDLKKESQTNLLQKNDLLNALLLNKKQTDESDQIFIPYNNMSSLSATLHSLICRQKKFPAEVFLSSWQGRYRCRLVCPLRALVSWFQRRFFLKNVSPGCKESRFHSLPFGHAVTIIH